MSASTDIRYVVTVACLIEDVSSTRALFGSNAEMAFPDCPSATAFFDSRHQLVGLGAQYNFSLVMSRNAPSEAELSILSTLAPFLRPMQALEWLFNPEQCPITDENVPDGIRNLSVGFTWSGDARDLENSVRNDNPDAFEDEMEVLDEMFMAKSIVAICWKYVRECEWTVGSNADLVDQYGQADWIVAGEGCSIISTF